MNSCPSADLLQSYVDEELDPAEAAMIEGHLEGCAACKSTLDDLDSMLAAGVLPSRQDTDAPRIAGFVFEERLGAGGFGTVWRARQPKLKRVVAVKVLDRVPDGSADHLARFQREAEVIAGLDDRHIVKIYDVQLDGRHPHYVMEYMPGGNLQRPPKGEVWNVREACEVVRKLAKGAAAAHEKNVVHRDIKPANVLVGADGEPRLADFGIAKRLGAEDELTRDGAKVGTPGYMSPEQAAGRSAEVGPASDVYSLGATLYQFLTGRAPFAGDEATVVLKQVIEREPLSPRKLRPDVPKDVETICLCCLSKEASRRYANAKVLAEDLGRFLAGMPISRRPISFPLRILYKGRRRPALVGLMAVSVALITGVILSAYQATKRESKRIEDLRSTAFELAADANLLAGTEKFQDALAKIDQSIALIEAERLDQPLLGRVREQRSEIALRHKKNLIRERIDEVRVAMLDIPLISNKKADYNILFMQVVKLLDDMSVDVLKDSHDQILLTASNSEFVHEINTAVSVLVQLSDSLDANHQPVARKELLEQLDRSLSRTSHALVELDKIVSDKTSQDSFDERLSRWLVVQSPDIEVLHSLSHAFCELGETKRAIDMARRAYRQDPNNFWSLMYMGRALILDKSTSRVIEGVGYVRMAVALKPQLKGMRSYVAAACMMGGLEESAIFELDRDVAKIPSTSSEQALRATALVSLNKHSEADAVLKSILSLEPDNFDALIALISLKLKLGDLRAARVIAQQMHSTRRTEFVPILQVAMIDAEQGRYGRALLLCQQASLISGTAACKQIIHNIRQMVYSNMSLNLRLRCLTSDYNSGQISELLKEWNVEKCIQRIDNEPNDLRAPLILYAINIVENKQADNVMLFKKLKDQHQTIHTLSYLYGCSLLNCISDGEDKTNKVENARKSFIQAMTVEPSALYAAAILYTYILK